MRIRLSPAGAGSRAGQPSLRASLATWTWTTGTTATSPACSETQIRDRHVPGEWRRAVDPLFQRKGEEEINTTKEPTPPRPKYRGCRWEVMGCRGQVTGVQWAGHGGKVGRSQCWSLDYHSFPEMPLPYELLLALPGGQAPRAP